VVGFNEGLTSALFLSANPNATVYVFDWFDEPNMPRIMNFLKTVYRYRLVDIVGNPIVTIPEFARHFAFGYGKGLNSFPILEKIPFAFHHHSWLRINSGVKCDVVLIDRSVHERDSLVHLRNFALLSHLSTQVIYENSCSDYHNAVRNHYTEEKNYGDRFNSWSQAIRDNLLREIECVEHHERVWEFCMAQYTRPYIMKTSGTTLNFTFSHYVVDAWTMRQLELQELHAKLADVARYSPDNSTVIITPVTSSFKTLALNLWCSFKKFGIGNVLFWVVDDTLKDEFSATKIPYYFNPKYSTVVATTFGQPIYHRMLRERFVLLQDIIELGFNFFFCDSDIAFASDFRAYIADYAKAENCDIIVQTDTSLDETWVETNGGFYFVQASNRTLQTFQMLQQFLFVNPEIEDQQALGDFTHLPTVCVTGLTEKFRSHYSGNVAIFALNCVFFIVCVLNKILFFRFSFKFNFSKMSFLFDFVQKWIKPKNTLKKMGRPKSRHSVTRRHEPIS